MIAENNQIRKSYNFFNDIGDAIQRIVVVLGKLSGTKNLPAHIKYNAQFLTDSLVEWAIALMRSVNTSQDRSSLISALTRAEQLLSTPASVENLLTIINVGNVVESTDRICAEYDVSFLEASIIYTTIEALVLTTDIGRRTTQSRKADIPKPLAPSL